MKELDLFVQLACQEALPYKSFPDNAVSKTSLKKSIVPLLTVSKHSPYEKKMQTPRSYSKLCSSVSRILF